MRYYSTQRPVMPGSFPRPNGTKVIQIHNFDARTYCPEIDREAWGWIEYNVTLTDKEASDYELIPERR